MSDEAKVPYREPGNVHLDDVNAAAARSPMYPLIAYAIQGYAGIEQNLCLLMAHTTGMAPDITGIIFFKIASAQSRNSILEKLIRKKHGDQFNPFWNSYFKALRVIDQSRNEIVHWGAVTNIDLANEAHATVKIRLTPPNFWDRDGNTPVLGPDELSCFIGKCDVFSRICGMFVMTLNGTIKGDDAKSWLEIFRQPLVYPLPEDHPLNQTPSTPHSPPQSSPGLAPAGDPGPGTAG
jgi:hypothetical protein